jgi:type IV pilus assembly protein PilA
MENLMKSLKNSRIAGFSLIELMVVVGIIGVLATVAIPQFSKFSSRAKQSEAKVNLGGVYTVEKAYYVEANTYNSCLAQLGYEASGQSRRYTIGFQSGHAMNAAGSISCTAGEGNTSFTAAGLAVTSLPATGMTNTTFLAGAVGNVSGKGNDQWTIDHNQNLQNTSPQL